mmetsp:Transcript_44807/g.83068  ORF Transcript_44807/g.83068 Transcript_44807/m.83068 type:complete len:89 (-) Transcript_44807:208-474(-)
MLCLTSGSFWMYSLLSMLGVIWLYFSLPETRGLSLEEIEEHFSRAWDYDIGDGKHLIKITSTSKLSDYGTMSEDAIKEGCACDAGPAA